MKKTDEELSSELKSFDERLKHQEEKNALYIKTFENELETKERLHKHELSLKDIEAKHDRTLLELRFYGIIGTIVFFLISSLITYLGRDYINNHIGSAIDTYAKPKVDSTIQVRLSQENIDTLIKIKVEAAILQLNEVYKSKADTAIKQSVNEFRTNYNNTLSVIKLNQIKPSNEVNDATKKQLADFDKALKQLKTEAQYNYEDWSYKAVSETQKNQFKEAIESYTKALKLQPEGGDALFGRAFSYARLGKYEQALADYNRLLQFYPNQHYEAYMNRGGCYMQTHEYEKALADFTKVIELAPKDTVGYYARSNSYFMQKKYALAISDIDSCIKLNPRSFLFYLNRGALYESLGENDKAISDYGKSIELNAQYGPTYDARSNVYYNSNQYDKAMIDLSKAIELNPEDALAYVAKGNCYVDLRQYYKAIPAFIKSIKLNPNYPIPYISLSGALIITYKYDDALKNTQKAMELVDDPEQMAICKLEQSILFKLLKKDTKKSEEDLNSALKANFKLKWKLFGIEDWLVTAKIDEETRLFIKQKIGLIKAKK